MSAISEVSTGGVAVKSQRSRRGNRCYWCGWLLCKTIHDPFQKTYDHVIPLSRGGKNTSGNKVVSCRLCNSIKGAMMPHEWDEFRKEFPDYRNMGRAAYAAWIKANLPPPPDIPVGQWNAMLVSQLGALPISGTDGKTRGEESSDAQGN